MKARVDSKEFSTAMAQAMKWTRVSGVDATGLVLLRAIDGYILIRTTIGDGDSILAVNAFDVEHGDVITRASLLGGFSWQTDGFLDISVDGRRLVLSYEDFANPDISTVKEAQFPSMLNVEYPVTLTKDVLLTAATHTLPFEKTGLPIKSSVHIIPAEGGAYVMAADGIVGYRNVVSGVDINAPISIEAKTLTQALGGIHGPVKIGVKEGRVEVASADAPSRIQFSSMSCPDPTSIAAFFDTETYGEQLEIFGPSIKKLAFLTSKAAATDSEGSSSQIMIGGNGVVTGRIIGQDVTIPEFEVADGDSIPIVFRCDALTRALSMLSSGNDYTVSMAMFGDEPRVWFIESEGGKHFIMASAGGMFKSDKSDASG